jgi:hypothetical protein
MGDGVDQKTLYPAWDPNICIYGWCVMWSNPQCTTSMGHLLHYKPNTVPRGSHVTYDAAVPQLWAGGRESNKCSPTKFGLTCRDLYQKEPIMVKPFSYVMGQRIEHAGPQISNVVGQRIERGGPTDQSRSFSDLSKQKITKNIILQHRTWRAHISISIILQFFKTTNNKKHHSPN